MKAILVLAMFCLAAFPCHAQKAMMFNNVDQYLGHAGGIWIVEVVKEAAYPSDNEGGALYEVKVLQTLKGDSPKTMTVRAVFQNMVPGGHYLVFGFNDESKGRESVWMDNGNISPVELPGSFSLEKLNRKTAKEQIGLILSARSDEIARRMKELSENKKQIDAGLEFQRKKDAQNTSGP